MCLAGAWGPTLLLATTLSCGDSAPQDTIHVHPGDRLQAAINRAAEDPAIHRVVVHAGTYRPPAPRQALIWLHRKHDGLVLEAEGEVILTAANPDVADPSLPSFPAVVNHVVYFGDGISARTVLRGFTLTGANNFVTQGGPEIQPDVDEPGLEKTVFFYTDGGAVKIFGRSYPTLERLTIVDNYSSPCAGGVSIEHRGFLDQAVTIRDCVFRNNRAPLTGPALDLLDDEKGSAARLENCLFLDNLANETMDELAKRVGSWKPIRGHGAVTVFRHSRLEATDTTFIHNRNGVDDQSPASTYLRCIFWSNTASGGWARGPHYEADILHAEGMDGCFLGGSDSNPRGLFDGRRNHLDAPDPDFDQHFEPTHPAYSEVGYRRPN